MIARIKNLLNMIPFFLKNRYLLHLYLCDMREFLSYSCYNTENTECIATKIRLLTHAIEKGLSLPNCRKGFGKQKILELIDLCNQYENISLPNDPQSVEQAYGVIKAYVEFHNDSDSDISFIPQKAYERALKSNISAGTKELKGTIDPSLFKRVAEHRHSLRYFSSVPVTSKDIEVAVDLAQTAPSACNRQPVHVYAVTTPEKINQIMKLHGGIRSLVNPSVIFVIAADRALYQSEYERNTAYVDGGIFTMNMLYALDSVGIASCPAIWGNIPEDDKKLRDIADISPSHTIINLIVGGYYPDEAYRVAASTKRETKKILSIIN